MKATRILHEKTQRFLRGIIHEKNTTISPRSAGVTCKFTVKMKATRILHEKTQRILRGWWRTEEGVYINKEQRATIVRVGVELVANYC